jgi:hypothetical protein
MICSTPNVWGRLNAFQKVMLQWSSLYPYSAVHVCRLAGPLRKDALAQSVAAGLLRLGVGIAHLSPDGQSYRHEVDRGPSVETIDAAGDAEQTLREYMTQALNRRFDRPCAKPFRFAAIEGDRQSHYVALAYDHWVADSTSARQLLEGVLGDYLRLPPAASQQNVDLYPGSYRQVFHQSLRGPRLLLSALRAIRQWNRNRSAWRVACWSNTEWTVDYRLYRTIPGTVTRLREFARLNGATVNDVFLAALTRALAEVMPARGKGRGLALGSIVDTRGAADIDLKSAFGAFLGYYLVRTQSDSRVGLDEATREIASLTRPIKADHRYMDSLINMQFINALWPWLSVTTQRHFMRKTLPMSGGISNVVVRDPWMDQNRNVILEYHRGVSTGPSLPIVLTPTTYGDQLNIGVSYRTAGFSSAKIDAAMKLLRDQLEHPNKASRGEIPRRPAASNVPDLVSARARQPLPEMASAQSETANR